MSVSPRAELSKPHFQLSFFDTDEAVSSKPVSNKEKLKKSHHFRLFLKESTKELTDKMW